MRERNEDVVRRGFAAFDTLDMDAFVADWHPDVIWDVSRYEGWPGDRVEFRGVADILAHFAEFHRDAHGLTVDIHEIRALDDERVIAVYTETRRDDDSDTRTSTDIGIVYRLEDGKVTRMEVYTGHQAARRAAGLL
jgi:ketosteroid isomerase-like protein